MSKVVGGNPDLIVLSGVAPADAPTLIRAARELGFQGMLSTETAQDIKILNEVAGDTANGFISVGGASTPEIRSPYMEEFAEGVRQGGRRVERRGRHQGLCARDHPGHAAEGGQGGDRRRRGCSSRRLPGSR